MSGTNVAVLKRLYGENLPEVWRSLPDNHFVAMCTHDSQQYLVDEDGRQTESPAQRRRPSRATIRT